MKWNGYFNSRPVTEGCARLRSDVKANFSNAFIIDQGKTKKIKTLNEVWIFGLN